MSECSVCGGSSWDMSSGFAVRCPCSLQRSQAQRLAAAGIPPRYQDRTLESFDGRVSRSATAALLMARGYVREYPTHRGAGMLLTGAVGTGKTHLAIAVLLACQRQYGASVRFVEFRDLFAQMRESFSGSNRTELLRPLLECDVLLIDEIGTARETEWQRETTERLIDGRYNANLATLCTTNYPNQPPGWTAPRPTPVASSFREGAQATLAGIMRAETLGDRIGAPMWSRLQEMCKSVEMFGEDQRTARRKA